MGQVGDRGGVEDFHGGCRCVHVELHHVNLDVFAKDLALGAALCDGHHRGVRSGLAQWALCDGGGEQAGCSGESQNKGLAVHLVIGG